MVTFIVIMLKIYRQFSAQLLWAVKFVDINALIFNTSPQAFDEDIIKAPASMIHADRYTGIYEYLSILRA